MAGDTFTVRKGMLYMHADTMEICLASKIRGSIKTTFYTLGYQYTNCVDVHMHHVITVLTPKAPGKLLKHNCIPLKLNSLCTQGYDHSQ